MGIYTCKAQRQRFRLSALLALIIGLCSIASPHHLHKAVVRHHAPTQSSRSFRDLTRSRASSSRTSSDAEMEPELPLERLHTALTSTFYLAGNHTAPVSRVYTFAVWLPKPPPALGTPRLVCISCSLQDDPSVVSTLAFRPHLGRAPPLA